MHHFYDVLSTWYLGHLAADGYLLIVLLMAAESSVVPIPSEIIIPPAAYIAFTQHNMTVPGVVIAGSIGCVLGAAIMYVVSRIAGRPFVFKYGKLVAISAQKVELAEQWTARFGAFGIFLSRFVPVVRHLIGIPAGIVRMNFVKFSAYTLAGSAIWCCVLAKIGLVAGQDEALRNGDVKAVTLWGLGAVVVLGAIYFGFIYVMMKKPQSKRVA